MITYITGVPGHGKSLRAMWYLNQPEYQGRPIYSNMEGPDGAKLPEGHQPIPDIWMQVEDGSVVVIDECQHRWPQRGPGTKTPDEEGALDTHRHRGIDFILMTQRATGVSHHVRGLVGKHEHLRRRAGIEASVIHRKDEAFNPKDTWELKSCDSEIWRYPKSLYGEYKSSVDHTGTYKFKMPTKARTFLILIGVGAVLVGGLIWKTTKNLDPDNIRKGAGIGELTQPELKGLEKSLKNDNTEYQPNDEIGVCVVIEGPRSDCKCFRNNARRANKFTKTQCYNWIVENGGTVPDIQTNTHTAASRGTDEVRPAARVRVSDTAHLSQF